MVSNLFKKNILFLLISLLIFFLYSSHNIYALPPGPVTDTVGVTARVGEEIIIVPGGGSSGGFVIPKTAVSFSGFAYPNATVTLLKNGENKANVKANLAGEFNITLEENYSSTIVYSLFAEDVSGNRSLLINYPIAVQVNFLTQLSGIRFAPTIVTDKAEVRFGDYLTVNGYALPQKDMTITMRGVSEQSFTLTSSENGSYKIVLPLTTLPRGDYSVFINYKDDTRNSKFIKFIIGETNIFFTDSLSSIPGDCNADKIINLIDFSILAFWYGKNNPPPCVDTNQDKIINLVDFSILAFYWTG